MRHMRQDGIVIFVSQISINYEMRNISSSSLCLYLFRLGAAISISFCQCLSESDLGMVLSEARLERGAGGDSWQLVISSLGILSHKSLKFSTLNLTLFLQIFINRRHKLCPVYRVISSRHSQQRRKSGFISSWTRGIRYEHSLASLSTERRETGLCQRLDNSYHQFFTFWKESETITTKFRN